jgi:hypothetical protein
MGFLLWKLNHLAAMVVAAFWAIFFPQTHPVTLLARLPFPGRGTNWRGIQFCDSISVSPLEKGAGIKNQVSMAPRLSPDWNLSG